MKYLVMTKCGVPVGVYTIEEFVRGFENLRDYDLYAEEYEE